VPALGLLLSAATLTGCGGLLLQMVWLRRFGAILGNTSGAAALVLGVFLCGLGGGSLLLARRPSWHRRPATVAALLYAAVAAWALAVEPLLRHAPPLGDALAGALLLAVPGVPALLMGAAFPLLFACLATGDRRGAGWLNAANLAGAVVGAWLGGNWLVPELGLHVSSALGAGAYVAAGLALAVRGRAERPVPNGTRLPPPTPPALPRGALALAASTGLLLLGFEVFLLRRLPFWLDGFQPTLSGVVAAVLLWGAVGAGVAAPLFRRVAGPRAGALAFAVALLACNLGSHEWLAPHVARLPIDSTLWLHLRILLCVSTVVALPCLALGAVVPLALAEFVHPQTRGLAAGWLFGALGLGELVGALLAGQALPRLLPQSYFALAPAVLSLAALLCATRAFGRLLATGLAVPVVLLACLGVSGAGRPWSPRPPVAGSRYDRGDDYVQLAHAVDAVQTASVAYHRRNHSLLLFTDEFRATETGPNTAYMRALGHLPFLLREGLQRAAVIALGTGITCDAVLAWPDPQHVDVVELSPAVVGLAPWFTADGPVPDITAGDGAPGFRRDPRAQLHVTDGRAFLARAAPGSLDVVTMEPLLPYAPGTVPLYTAEFYALADRALSDRGLLLQWVPSHAMPRATFASLLHTFAAGFTHTSIWLVDHSTLLVGSRAPHLPDHTALAERMAALPGALRDALHDCGLAGPDDLHVAFVSAQRPPAARLLGDDAPFLERLGYWSGPTKLRFLADNLLYLSELVAVEPPSALRELRMRRLSGLRSAALATLPDPGPSALASAVLDLDAARASAEHSVLLHREQARALRSLYEERIASAPTLAQARPVADLLLARDSGSALALATLAAAASDADQQRALCADALALDPRLLFALPPALAAALRHPLLGVSPREDLSRLPAGAELAAAAAAAGPRATALRGTFPARVARSLVELAATRPLAAAERAALAPLLDPLTWARFAAAVRVRRGDLAAEVLPLWRRDLPLAAPLTELLEGDVQARVALADALAGRRDAAACETLARLLLDVELPVRAKAAFALQKLVGSRIPYDPAGDESLWRAAASAVRRLHNSPP
jgi:spermidine synthase